MKYFLKIISAICILCSMNLSPAYAADDMDWTVKSGSVTEAGPGTPIAGQRWTLGSTNEGVSFIIHLDSSTDMMRGNWYGHIRASERFYSKVYYIDETGNKNHLKLEEAGAIGPDAEYGIWKKGPTTAKVQVLQFDFTRDHLMTLKGAKALIVNYASFETPQDTHDIIFPMDVFKTRLAELDASIEAKGGQGYLMSSDDIQNTPIQDLPAAIRIPTQDGMTKVAKELSVPLNELTSLSINQVKAKIENKKTADREAKRAAKRAAHQAIYDQEPDWLDLNLCPKPDVKSCRNVGLEAYENSVLLGGDFSYGKIKGVVWRSKGSIIRVYGGSIDLGIEPEIYRTSSAGYYYIVKNDKGHLNIRSVTSMLTR